MLPAGVGNGMEAGNRTPGASHAEIEEDPDGRGPASHDLIQSAVEIDRRGISGHSTT
jgi:hypothetical protein